MTFDPVTFFLRLCCLFCIAWGFTALAFVYVATYRLHMEQLYSLWGLVAAVVLFVWAAVLDDMVGRA